MMKKLLSIISILICFIQGNGQNLMGNRWVAGGWRTMYIQFNGASTPTMNIQYDSSGAAVFPYYYITGHSNICDSITGKLMFSTTGMLIHDTTGSIMDNGDNLVDNEYYNSNFYPASPYTQSSLILPKGNNGQYYVFISNISDSAWNFYVTNVGAGGAVPSDRLQYSIVDMNLNNGKGRVIVKNKMLMQGAAIHKSMMQACRHSNGVDWWLLKQGEYDTNRIYRLLVKADTIEGPWIQNFAEPKYPSYDLAGQYAFSKDGTKFVSIQGKGKMNKLFIADFDRCTGELSNPVIRNIPIDSNGFAQLDNQGILDSINTGVCFSSNGQFIYISKRYNIYQYEYNEPDSSLAWYRVQHGPDTSFAFQYFGHLALGMDGRIYIGNQNGQLGQMSVIDEPDIKGIGCQFCRKCLRSSTPLYFGLTAPPNMPDYTLGASGQVCWPLDSGQWTMENGQLGVYPNPASDKFQITNSKFQNETKKFFNSVGQLIFATKENEIDVSRLSKGIYYLKCGGRYAKVVVE